MIVQLNGRHQTTLDGFCFRDYIKNLLKSEYYPDPHASLHETYIVACCNDEGRCSPMYELCVRIGFLMDVFQFILSRTCSLGSYINTSVHSVLYNDVNKIFDFLREKSQTINIFGLGYSSFVFIMFFNYTGGRGEHGYTDEFSQLFKAFFMDYQDSYNKTKYYNGVAAQYDEIDEFDDYGDDEE